MKSITIHGIDKTLAELIKSKAIAEGLSMNKTIKKLLEESLGVKPRDTVVRRNEFERFCGLWSETDKKEFEDRTKALGEIDNKDWR